MTSEQELARSARAWPFEEARRLLARVERKPPTKGYVLFETGYGPSGLPHLGTFGEVARTTMVRQAFQRLSSLPTRLFAFSDDMDGLRKIPDNVPQPDMLREYLGQPLTSIPDPFGTHESFGHHNNARLRSFLDRFGFEYEFQSASDWYRSGRLDATLRKVLEHYDEIMALMLPTLGEGRQQSYSPFLPLSPKTGRVLQVSILEQHPDKGTIVFRDEDGTLTESPITGGSVKLQWKPDWGMRWAALDVDYEMYGKDLIPSAILSAKIATILGAVPPEGFSYELFLDQNGQKISKSKGNGLSLEEWLTYGPTESLSFYMFQKPRAAKRLHFDVIPRAVDDYLTFCDKFASQTPEVQIENPVWSIHNGAPPISGDRGPLTYGLLLNLVTAVGAASREALWAFITRHSAELTPASAPMVDRLVEYALNYHRDFVQPTQQARLPTPAERLALADLDASLATISPECTVDADGIQAIVYAVGKRHPFAELKDWFQALYEVLLGQSAGPRIGTFIAILGIEKIRTLIREALTREQTPGATTKWS